jgi:hypothetical protein
MRRSKHARQGVFSHQGLRKASAANPANTGLAGSAGMAAVETVNVDIPHEQSVANFSTIFIHIGFF